MGLAINGNVVHGIARGGQAFLPIDTQNSDSITYNGQKYINVANASLDMTMIDEQNGAQGTNSSSVTFTTLTNFSEYSFYQITLDIGGNSYVGLARIDTITFPFVIKPNVKTPISTVGSQNSLTINVFAHDNNIDVSVTLPDTRYTTQSYTLYGYKIN